MTTQIPPIYAWKGEPLSWDILDFIGDHLLITLSTNIRDYRDIAFSLDGTKVFFIESVTESIYEYSLTTPWRINTASQVRLYDTNLKNITNLEIKPDGTTLFVLAGSTIHQYNLPTPWSLLGITKSPITNTITGSDFRFSPDGSKIYTISTPTSTVIQTSTITEYNLSIPWNISTISLWTTTTISGKSSHINFRADGVKMYVSRVDGIKQFHLPTPWETANAIDESISSTPSFITNFGANQSFIFGDDGKRMYQKHNRGLYLEYLMEYPWDLASTRNPHKHSTLSTPPDTFIHFRFKPDGKKLFALSRHNYRVREFDLPTPWDIKQIKYNGKFSQYKPPASFSWQLTGVALDLAFNPDGTRLYILEPETITQYNLPIPWDISTTIYQGVRAIGHFGEAPVSIAFSPDGRILYTAAGDFIFEFDLTTPWEVSTAVHSSNSVMAVQKVFLNEASDNAIRDIFFNPDGTQLFVVQGLVKTGLGTNRLECIEEYTLSQPWRINDAVYSGRRLTRLSAIPIQSAAMNLDGSKLFTLSNSRLIQYGKENG